MRILALLIAFCFVLRDGSALAHGAHADIHDLSWNWEWWVMASLALPSLLYAAGIWRMWQRLGPGRVIAMSQIAAFAAGMLVLFIALESPIDTLADQLFWLHMVQHLLLMFAAPPLLVWSRPPIVFMWAFRSRSRRTLGRIWTGVGFNRLVRWMMHPSLVWVLFSGLFIFWHFPKPYTWAVNNEAIHVTEHLCFFASALMFWTIVIEPSGRRRLGYGATLLHVATTSILGGLPGALLVLSTRPIYLVHAAGEAAWGLTPLQDQHLAGVIMWVPAGIAYVMAISWLFAKWLEDAERQEIRRAAQLSASLTLAALISVLTFAASESANAQSLTVGGNRDRGAALIRQFGCGSCHTIPGIGDADGLVGPPLDNIGSRIYLAGVLRNTPDNMVEWLMHPQKVVPGNAMPDMHLTRAQARDITAYLYTLR